MHMHGHNMYILATGSGLFNGSLTNPQNPTRRDVQILPPALGVDNPSYIVVQFDADNPGVWPVCPLLHTPSLELISDPDFCVLQFHCHIAWHVSAGLYINMIEQPDAIAMDMQIPSIVAQTCRNWAAWTGGHVPDEIDSGL